MNLWPVLRLTTGELFLVDVAVRVTALVGLASLVECALRNQSAAARRWLWCLAVVTIFVAPAMMVVLPRFEWNSPIADPAALITNSVVTDNNVPANSNLERPSSPTNGAAPDTIPSLADTQSSNANPSVTLMSPEVPVHWLVPVFFGGLVMSLGSLFRDVLVRRYLLRSSRPVTDPKGQQTLDRLAAGLGISRPIQLREIDKGVSPMTWGIFSHVLLLPEQWKNWPQDRLRTVLLHELGHIDKRDFSFQFLAKLCCCLYWFHPLAWLAARRLRLECEHAADDFVLRCSTAPREYVCHLVEIAKNLNSNRRSAAAVLGATSSFELRIESALDEGRCRKPLSRRSTVLGSCVAVVTLLMVTLICPNAGFAQQPAATVEGDIAIKLSLTNQEAKLPSLVELVQAIENHEKRLDNLHLKERSFPLPLDDDAIPEEKREYTTSEFGRRAKVHAWFTKSTQPDGTQFNTYCDGIRVTDDRRWEGMRPDVLVHPNGARLDLLADAYSLRGLFLRFLVVDQITLSELIKRNALTAQVEQNGDDVKVTLQWSTNQSTTQMTIVLAREYEWHPVRIDYTLTANGTTQVSKQWRAVEVIRQAGCFLVKRGEFTSYSTFLEDGDKNHPRTWEFEVTEFDAGSPLPLTDFQYRVPEGATVRVLQPGGEFKREF